MIALPSSARAQSPSAEPPVVDPSPADVARAEVTMVDALRRCLPTGSGWRLRAELAFDLRRGRVLASAPAGVTWSPAERRCVTQAAARVRSTRSSNTSYRPVTIELAERDPRPRLLGAVDPAACVPPYDPCNCQINAAVSMNARRPGVVASVSFTVQGCMVLPLQMACLEQAVRRLPWPVNPRDPDAFDGPVGPACGH